MTEDLELSLVDLADWKMVRPEKNNDFRSFLRSVASTYKKNDGLTELSKVFGKDIGVSDVFVIGKSNDESYFIFSEREDVFNSEHDKLMWAVCPAHDDMHKFVDAANRRYLPAYDISDHYKQAIELRDPFVIAAIKAVTIASELSPRLRAEMLFK